MDAEKLEHLKRNLLEAEHYVTICERHLLEQIGPIGSFRNISRCADDVKEAQRMRANIRTLLAGYGGADAGST